MVRVIDYLTGTKFVRSAEVLEKAVRIYGEHVTRDRDISSQMFGDMTAAALRAFISQENAICWEVHCTHVADYLDKSYADYVRHSDQATRLLSTIAPLVYDVLEDTGLDVQVKEFFDEHRRTYEKYLALQAQRAMSTPTGTRDSGAAEGAVQ